MAIKKYNKQISSFRMINNVKSTERIVSRSNRKKKQIDILLKDNKIIKITDSFNSHSRKGFGNEQIATKQWLIDKLDTTDIMDLINYKTVGKTVKKGRGFSHITLERRKDKNQ